MIRFGNRAVRPLRGRALPMNRVGLLNPIETRQALLICAVNHRFTTRLRNFSRLSRVGNGCSRIGYALVTRLRTMRAPAHQLSEIIGFVVMVSREQGRAAVAPKGERDEYQPPARLTQSDVERFRSQSGTAS